MSILGLFAAAVVFFIVANVSAHLIGAIFRATPGEPRDSWLGNSLRLHLSFWPSVVIGVLAGMAAYGAVAG